MLKKHWHLAVLWAVLAVVTAAYVWAARVKIVIEAENYVSITPSMTVGSDKTASASKYVHIPLRRPHGENESGPADTGNTVYKFKIPVAGVYRLWVRANWYDSCGDSFFVIVNDQAQSWVGEDGTYQKWHWVKGKTYQFSAGVHSIKFQNREDGAKLDQFLLTNDLRYVPTRIEKQTPSYIVRN
ncbi:MAG: hypothetical protein N2512_09390 [Armatimonadetes bacterium]|nr:hypothetical protein [Armatimonadota bacterium]